MRNFATRSDDTVWTPVSNPPPERLRVTVTHAGDVFKTETTGMVENGKWQCAVAFMTNGGRTLDFNPTHWRHTADQVSA